MSNNTEILIENAKVMSKGQITIPKEIRNILGISNGDKVTFLASGNEIRVVNTAVYAMHMFQSSMDGEARRANLNTDEDVMELVKSVREEAK